MRFLYLSITLAISMTAFAGQKYDYNLEDESKDFAELSMDVSSRQAIGKTIRISVREACSQPGATNDRKAGREFPTLFCDDKSNGHFYATGSKKLRLRLTKLGRGEVIWLNGRVVGGSDSMPIIELEDK